MAHEPPDPAARWPRRGYDFALATLVGWDEATVLARLGPPDARGGGDAWPAGDPGQATMRGPDGEIRERIGFFGVLPRTIALLVPYQAWSYHNVAGQTWVLYLVRDGAEPLPAAGPARHRGRLARWLGRSATARPAPARGGTLRVVEVAHYPTGAVF